MHILFYFLNYIIIIIGLSTNYVSDYLFYFKIN